MVYGPEIGKSPGVFSDSCRKSSMIKKSTPPVNIKNKVEEQKVKAMEVLTDLANCECVEYLMFDDSHHFLIHCLHSIDDSPQAGTSNTLTKVCCQ